MELARKVAFLRHLAVDAIFVSQNWNENSPRGSEGKETGASGKEFFEILYERCNSILIDHNFLNDQLGC